MDERTEVVYVPERQRYELLLGERVIGFADIRDQGDSVLFPYVEIVRELRGREFGAQLVRGALEDVRKKGKRPIPICPFVVAYLRRHPELAA